MATRTVTADDKALDDAVADTEAEIFADSTGTDEAENSGDRSLEEMEPEVAEPEAKTEDEPEKDEPARDEQGRFTEAKPEKTEQKTEPAVPPGRLREESERARKAEALAAEKDAAIESLKREFEALKTGLTAPKAPVQEPQKVEPPDMFADPEGWARHQRAEIQTQFQSRFVEGSLSDAADTHGEKFQSAYSELQKIGQAEKSQFGSSPTVNRIWNAPNPGKALMNWHQQQLTVREVGGDPNAWLEKKIEERFNDPDFLAKAVERAKQAAQQGDNGKPRTATRLPPSLNSQTGGTHQDRDPDLYDASEESVFDFATR
jgi:hypothetical protein